LNLIRIMPAEGSGTPDQQTGSVAAAIYAAFFVGRKFNAGLPE
jgi:hypothetical protein